MRRSKSSPAESNMSLQYEQAKLGRGAIQNPVPRCVELANKRLRPLRHHGSANGVLKPKSPGLGLPTPAEKNLYVYH